MLCMEFWSISASNWQCLAVFFLRGMTYLPLDDASSKQRMKVSWTKSIFDEAIPLCFFNSLENERFPVSMLPVDMLRDFFDSRTIVSWPSLFGRNFEF